MKITPGPLAGLLIIEPSVFTDDRGYFYECFQQQRYAQYEIPAFVQDNVSRSKHNVIRGLHYQLPHAQGKLVGVTYGKVWDVVVDIRASSPTFGKWIGITLSDENHTQMYIPPGFAHGFCVQSEEADFYYKCTEYYDPASERGIAWDDHQLNIPWPVTGQAIISPKDNTYPSLLELSHEQLFT
jgi:dTDP-4-dehydrorhamnose 3,5-epimerase